MDNGVAVAGVFRRHGRGCVGRLGDKIDKLGERLIPMRTKNRGTIRVESGCGSSERSRQCGAWLHPGRAAGDDAGCWSQPQPAAARYLGLSIPLRRAFLSSAARRRRARRRSRCTARRVFECVATVLTSSRLRRTSRAATVALTCAARTRLVSLPALRPPLSLGGSREVVRTSRLRLPFGAGLSSRPVSGDGSLVGLRCRSGATLLRPSTRGLTWSGFACATGH
jgi:hypothetical protein